jgi:hypothetical protein
VSRKTKHHARKNRLRFCMPLAGEFAYSRLITGSVLGQDPANVKHRVAGLLDLGIPQDRISTTAGVYLPEAHNGLVRTLLQRRDWDGVVWLEHDHQFDYQMVQRMETYEQDIVGVPYVTRDANNPQLMVASFTNREHPEQSDPPYGIRYLPPSQALQMIFEPGLYEVDFVPHGMTFVHRRVYEALPYPWYAAGDTHELGDDVYFIAKAREAGFKVYADSSLYSGHMTLVSLDAWSYVRELRRRFLELNFGHLLGTELGGGDISKFLPEGFAALMAEFRKTA